MNVTIEGCHRQIDPGGNFMHAPETEEVESISFSGFVNTTFDVNYKNVRKSLLLGNYYTSVAVSVFV